MFVSNSRVSNVMVCEADCFNHSEILTLSFYVLLSSYGCWTGSALCSWSSQALAVERITDSYNEVQCQSAENPAFLIGDFNCCDVSSYLPNLDQYVTCSTWNNKIWDECFGNIDDAHVVRCCPPLGQSDLSISPLSTVTKKLILNIWRVIVNTKSAQE